MDLTKIMKDRGIKMKYMNVTITIDDYNFLIKNNISGTALMTEAIIEARELVK